MRRAFTLTLAAMAAWSSAQTPVSGYDFRDTLDPYLDNNPPYVLPLEHRTGSSPTQPYGPTLYSDATVGTTNKRVVEFGAPQFLRALHGMNANGGGSYVNLYSIVFDVKFDSPAIGTWTSLFNTNADNANDGDSFVRWDDDGTGNPVGRIGISGTYAGDVSPGTWHRIVVTVDCTQNSGFDTTLTFFVDGVQVNQVVNSSGLDGRWAAYCWNDPDAEDNIDLFGDNDGDNGSGQCSLVVFYDSALSVDQVVGLGPVGTTIGSTTTETLAPTAEQFVRGQGIAGNLASWAADDANPRNVRKFIVVNQTEAFIRINLDYTTTKANPTAISFVTKARMLDGGVFRISLFLRNDANAFVQVLGETAIGLSFATFTGNATGTLTDYVQAAGAMRGQIVVRQAGPSTAILPRSSFETGNMVVTG